jgi:hypothetical protein
LKTFKTLGYLLDATATHPATAAEYEMVFYVNYIATKKTQLSYDSENQRSAFHAAEWPSTR